MKNTTIYALITETPEIKERDMKKLGCEELECIVRDAAVYGENGPEIVATYETKEEAMRALEAVKHIGIKHCGGAIPVCKVDYYAVANLVMSEEEDCKGEKFVEEYEIEAERMPIEAYKQAEEDEEEDF